MWGTTLYIVKQELSYCFNGRTITSTRGYSHSVIFKQDGWKVDKQSILSGGGKGKEYWFKRLSVTVCFAISCGISKHYPFVSQKVWGSGSQEGSSSAG